MTSKDRTEIYNIISEMLDNPDSSGIYPTSTAYNRLEAYIRLARAETVGHIWAEACIQLDKGEDPRLYEIPKLLDSVEAILNPSSKT